MGKIEDNNVRIEDAGDVKEYIDGVMVHPLAPQWYVKIVEDICKMKTYDLMDNQKYIH